MFRCISSCSYIKPQLRWRALALLLVVYHLVPTSNHNCKYFEVIGLAVVYHLVPTSNHNGGQLGGWHKTVVYHLVPTSNHNPPLLQVLARRVVYHLVPTSNHNCYCCIDLGGGLYIILFLHQTTTPLASRASVSALYIILFLHQTTTYSCKSTGNQ